MGNFLDLDYEPCSLANYRIFDPKVQKMVDLYVTTGATRPLILHGPPGTGKTTLAKILPHEICPDIQNGDIKFISGARNPSQKQIDDLAGWCALIPLNNAGMRFVIVDEVDELKSNMNTLKGVMQDLFNIGMYEVYFIMTTNHLNAIPQPIIDRSNVLKISEPSVDDMTDVMMEVLKYEDHQVPRETLRNAIDSATYGGTISYRSALKIVEQIIG